MSVRIVLEMAFLDVGPIMFGGTEGVIHFFKTKRVLASSMQCTRLVGMQTFASSTKTVYIRCNVAMQSCTRKDVMDGAGWWCPSCKTRQALRTGSFISKSKLTLQTWLMLIHFWARQNPVLDTADCTKVSKNTTIDVYQWLREVCSTRLIRDGPVMLGGPGIIVQIDESLFNHKPKVLVL